eukprot:sb/3466434/
MISEFSTIETRARSITCIYVLWGFGALFVSVAAYLTMNQLGWRALVITVCIPLFIAACSTFLIPETPKFLAASGDLDKAREILDSMAWDNGVCLPDGVLVASPVEKRGEMGDMFQDEFKRNSILLMICYFSTGFVFYTGYAMLPFLLQEGYCGIPVIKSKPCSFSTGTLKEAAMVTAAEIIFLPFASILTEAAGRLFTARLISSVLVVVSVFLTWCLGAVVFFVALFIQRGATQSLFNVLFIYTPELYPTYMRAVSCGVVMSFMTLGGLASSLLVYTIGVGYSWRLLLSLVAFFAFLSCICTFLLQNETQGAALPDAIEVGSCIPCRFCKKKPEEPDRSE